MAKIGIVEIKKGKTTWADIPLAGGFFPRIYWTSDPQKLAVVHLDRKQKKLDLYMVNRKTGQAGSTMHAPFFLSQKCKRILLDI